MKSERRGFLDRLEWLGNKLPEPALLFAILALTIVVLSGVGECAGWQAQAVKPTITMTPLLDASGAAVLDAQGQPKTTPLLGPDGTPTVELVPVGPVIQTRSLVDSDGVYWMLSSMLRNFTGLPALGLIFVAMLGIGLAERFGFFAALMRALAFLTPRRLVTPVIVFIGANASVASDAGYIILPPLAAGLFLALGRHPVAGLAAAFAGVAGGFGAGFFPTGGDGALAGFAQDAAHIIDPTYNVNILHNLHFKMGSAILVTLIGWFVTDRIVEPRLRRTQPLESTAASNAASGLAELALSPREKRALAYAIASGVLVAGLFAALILVPGMPLNGPGQPTLADGRAIVHLPITVSPPGDVPAGIDPNDVLARDPLTVVEKAGRARLVEPPSDRWAQAIVPMIFFLFLIPGLVYGRLTGTMKSQRDLVDGLYAGIRSIVPILVIAFFMGQFVAYFSYTGLDRILAYSGGTALAEASLPVPLLIALFVLLVVMGDFAISGMLSKFGILAPIFIPMFMMVGISPELTTAAYRIGDSVVNIVTPLNSYLLVILAVLQKYRTDAGLGSLIALMFPYSVFLGLFWTVFLLVWYAFGIDLGPGAALDYFPGR